MCIYKQISNKLINIMYSVQTQVYSLFKSGSILQIAVYLQAGGDDSSYSSCVLALQLVCLPLDNDDAGDITPDTHNHVIR